MSTKADAPIIAYKGFDKDWKCRGFQFEVGKTYTQDGKVERCESGFHSCEYPLDVFYYYPASESFFAVVEASGTVSRETDGDTKIASASISIKAEIKLHDMIAAAVKYVFDRATTTNKGTDQEVRGAASATGDSGAASATGDSGAAMASGRFGKAMGANGCAVFLVYRDDDWNIVHAKAAIAGKDIKADVWYMLDETGAFVEAA